MKKRLISMVVTLGVGPVLLSGALHAETGFLSFTRAEEPLDRLPSNVSIITQDEITRTGAKTLDDVLDHVVAADVSRTGTLGMFSTIRLRGVPLPEQVQVVIDDRPVGGHSIQFTDVSQIPVENIDRVEVVRGGSSVLYGANTLGGVIHVITKRHTAKEAHSSIGVESRSFKSKISRADLGAAVGRFDGYVNGSRIFTDGFQQNSDVRNISVSGNGGYSFSKGGRIALDISHSNNDGGDPQGTPIPADQWDGERERAAADLTQRVSQDITAGRVYVSLPLGTEAGVQSIFYGSDQDYLRFAAAGAPAFLDQDNRITGADTRFILPGGLMVGGSYERNDRKSSGNPSLYSVIWGAYIQENLVLGKMILIPAARLDQHNAFGNVLNPRMTVVYGLSDRWKLSGNAARSFRAPTLSHLYENSPTLPPSSGPVNGNPDLRPETAWTYDLGLQHRTSDNRQIGVTGFHTHIRDRIVTTANPFPAPNTHVNGPAAALSGVEVESAGHYGPLTEKINYTYQRARGNSSARSRFVPLTLTPLHMANCRLTWTTARGWSLTNTVQYVHRQFQFDGEAGTKLPSYTLWNARVSKKILGAELYFAADNITDKHYAESFVAGGLNPQPGRTYWGGMTIRFSD